MRFAIFDLGTEPACQNSVQLDFRAHRLRRPLPSDCNFCKPSVRN